jgi:hypothetical protein
MKKVHSVVVEKDGSAIVYFKDGSKQFILREDVILLYSKDN